jgi:glycine oxidase
VVVVGGGIVGLSLAYELVRRRVNVLVLEARHVGAGAGGVAAGMLAPGSEADHGTPALFQLAKESQRLYPEWVRGVEAASGLACGFREEGTLFVALSHDDEAEIARLTRFQDDFGVGGEWLTAEQTRELEPQLSPRATGALSLPEDRQVDPQALLAALHRAVEALGGRVVERARVTGFETAGGRIIGVAGVVGAADTADGVGSASGAGAAGADGAGALPFEVRCETAVLAAGAWSSHELAWPAKPLGVRPVKGQVLHLSGPELVRHVLRTPHCYLVPRAGGRLVVGATLEEQGFDASPTAGAVMDLLWHARLLVPAIYDLALAEVRVGFRPATRDHQPVIGETGVPGLYAATGHFRHGVLLAPATATLLADELAGGTPSPLLHEFRPERERAVVG